MQTLSDKSRLRLAAVGDLHCTRKSAGGYREMFCAVNECADALALVGDLTDNGLPEEAQVLIEELSVLRVPIIAVLGNHDFESGKSGEVVKLLGDVGATVLDGNAHAIGDFGFAGCKGFAGGFSGRSLEPWGEVAIKNFVHESVDEALKLEASLARLSTRIKIGLLHYSPVRDTVIGEDPEILPFLGSRRLEEPLDRFGATAVFHGHSHFGSLEGKTKNGVPVYNVAMPLIRRSFPGQPPFRLVTF